MKVYQNENLLFLQIDLTHLNLQMAVIHITLHITQHLMTIYQLLILNKFYQLIFQVQHMKVIHMQFLIIHQAYKYMINQSQ